MELLTVKEVAKKLKMSEVTIRRWIKNGKLKANCNSFF
ncbi:MAG: helix-turn-helix domain-containing protein [Halanaerobiales bacterium]|nr:helix-turn-helix domain-containing protein [Halanaerobiales bacterium]